LDGRRPILFLKNMLAMYAIEQMESRRIISIRQRANNCSLAKRLIHIQRNSIMNKNQIKGSVKDLAGKVQEEAGKLVGNKEQEAKGIHNQVTGKAEVRLGDAKERVHDAKNAVKDAVNHR
jgi:uncharacterized protein YjbJ (UPF0337 family)